MNPSIQFKNATILPLLIALTLGCFALSPQARADCQEGCIRDFNTVLGEDALSSLTTGGYNTAMGHSALYSNTWGFWNTASGWQALYSNTSGGSNNAFGFNALYSNTTGFNNTANGGNALYNNTTGYQNTATGVRALSDNTTGFNNTADGLDALEQNTTGSYNTAIGIGSLFSNSDGSNNTAIGANALPHSKGDNNIALGRYAGRALITGSYNIDIGNVAVGNDSGTIRIGTTGTQTATFIAGISGTAVAGDTVVVDGNGQLGTVASAARFKKEIKPMDKTSEAILALKPVSFQYKSDSKGTPQFGLIAEEVVKVNPHLVVRDRKGEIYSVRYEAVNAMLLNEFLKEHRTVQELKSAAAKHEAIIARQQKQIEALTAGLQKVSAQVEMSRFTPQTVVDNH